MANNVNNGITGVIDIPGALRSRGAADGNLVGGVVAYAGDIYDTLFSDGINTGMNQAAINAYLKTNSGTDYTHPASHPASMITYNSSTEYESGNVGYAIKALQTAIAGVPTYSAGTGIIISNNTISVDATQLSYNDLLDKLVWDVNYGEGVVISGLTMLPCNIVGGSNSVAMGAGATVANSYGGIAAGYITLANGWGACANGAFTYAEGSGTHVEGKGLMDSNAIIRESYTQGNTDIIVNQEFPVGAIILNKDRSAILCYVTNCEEYGNYYKLTLSAGLDQNLPTGKNIQIIGYAKGIGAHAEGCGTIAKGDGTHAEGMYTVTNNEAEHACGKYNKSTPEVRTLGSANVSSYGTQFSIGIGSSYTQRVNAFEVLGNGNIYVKGLGNYDGKSIANVDSLQTVITDVNTRLSDLEAASSSSSSSPEYISYYAGQGYSIGSTTTASGEHSFAEGLSTNASGNYSHAEGYDTTATGNASHAEGSGYYTYAYVHSAYTAGDTTIILEHRVYPGQYLSRRNNERYDAVKISDVYSHPSNPGIFEVSLEEGFSANLAYHNYVYIFGGALSYESHAEGEGCTANGWSSHAEGTGTTAFGSDAHSEGKETLAYGSWAHSEGKETLAYGDYSHTEGSETNAREGGHSEGNKTYAYGDYSHAEGHQTLAYGNYSHAEGKGYDKTVTVGSNYVARQTTIDLLSPVTPGQFLAITDNINKYRYGEMELIKILGCQEDTNNLGHYIVTLQYGMNNSVNAGDTLHIYSAASGSYSHSEGNNTSASGDNSHAEGDHTSASGESSHTEGKCTQTTNEAEHACGKYNLSTLNQTLFSIGNGTSSTTRKNAIEVDNNGNVYIKGIGTYDGTNIGQNGVKSVQQVIADLTLQIAALTNN